MIFLSKEDKLEQPTSIAVGMFDGLHLGHQSLMRRLKENAKAQSTLVFTFLLPDIRGSIFTNDEKKRLLSGLGVDYAYMQEFTPGFLATDRDAFIAYLKNQYNMKTITLGDDFRFGKGAGGDEQYLEKNANKFGYTVQVVPPVIDKGEKVSSTRIRGLIAAGDVAEAGRLLDKAYFVSGRVTARFGPGIDLPTINIYTDKLKPAFGVYATMTQIEGQLYQSVTSVGNAAVSKTEDVGIETNIFDFNDKIYDKDATVYFIDKVRDEIQFARAAELQSRIAADRGKALELLSNKNVYKIY